jgi:hypothetical protein
MIFNAETQRSQEENGKNETTDTILLLFLSLFVCISLR